MRSGTLYKSGGKKSGELSVTWLVRKLKAVGYSLRWVGLVFILIALGGSAYVYQPLVGEELRYYLSPPTPSSKLGSALRDLPNWQPPDLNYSLYIPKIAAKSVVVKDVNVADETLYLEALKRGVAAAQGLSHPGEMGTTYLFAHSTDSPLNYARFNAVFYLLDKVEAGDPVEVMYENKLHKYVVEKKEILAATDVKYLTVGQGPEQLVLQTCYPPGTTWKRLVVVAKPVY